MHNELSVVSALACNYGTLETFLESLTKADFPQDTQFLFCIDGVKDQEFHRLVKEFCSNRSSHSQVLSNTHPAGFTVSINKIMKNNSSKYTLLMDSDVILTENCIQTLCNEIEPSNVAAIQPILLYPQTMKIQSFGHVFGDNFNRHALAGRNMSDLPNLTTRSAQGITTACQLFKTELFHSVGGLDDEYYNAYGGLDLSLRFRNKGYQTLVTPNAKAYHFQGKTRTTTGLNQSMSCSHFWVKWSHLIKADFFNFFEINNLQESIETKVINVSNLPNWKAFLPLIDEEYFTIRNRGREVECFEELPYSFLDYPGNLIFLCDHYSQVLSNEYWFHLRNKKKSIIFDLH